MPSRREASQAHIDTTRSKKAKDIPAWHIFLVTVTILAVIYSLSGWTFRRFPYVLPFSCLSILLSIYTINLKPRTRSFLRDFLTGLKLYRWFPCNTLKIKKQSLISVHPHGVQCCGAIAGIHLVDGSETISCVAPIMYFVPFVGQCLNLLGCIPATRASMEAALRDGYSLINVSGGVPEVVLTEMNSDTEFYPRFGFLNLARNFRVQVLTVFSEGETATFNVLRLPWLRERVKLSRYFNFPLMLPFMSGYYGLWIPKRVKIRLRSYCHSSVPTKEQYTQKLNILVRKCSRRRLKVERH